METIAIGVPYQKRTNSLNIPAINKKNVVTFEEILKDPWFTESGFLNQKQQPMQNVKFWFHGTNTERALNIVKSGIDITYGRPGLDFSHGRSFYLTRYFQDLACSVRVSH